MEHTHPTHARSNANPLTIANGQFRTLIERVISSSFFLRRAVAQCALAGCLAASFVAASAVSAQLPPRADSTLRDSLARLSPDSLAARLARAEAAIALLRAQLGTEASSQVRLRSRLRLDLHARLLTNTFFTSSTSNSPEVPIFARAGAAEDDYGTAGGKALGISVRQTTMGGSLSVDSVAGATFSADFEVDFFGGGGGDASPLFPPPRLRTARGFLKWAHTELMVGADTPLISDLDPISLSAIAVPNFSTAGNLWNWLPQIRVTRELGVLRMGDRALHIALQGSVMNPFTGERHPSEPDGVDAGLRSARPSVETRVRTRWGIEHDATSSQHIGDRGGEIGIGAHRGWLRVSGDTLTSAWAVGADVRVGLSHGLELRGEAYRGRLIRGLGGGGIGQNFAPSALADSSATVHGDPLTDTAGWLQLNAQLRATLIAGAGCGTDRVHNGLPARQRNTACATHLAWRPASPLVIDLEYRNIVTRGPAGRFRATHLNLAFGIEL